MMQAVLAPPPSVTNLGTIDDATGRPDDSTSAADWAVVTPGRGDAHGLPPQPTPLLDREEERAAAAGLLDRDDVHLVTLVGPGGVGKTHLALAVADALADRFPGGVRFVDLAACHDQPAARSAILTALRWDGASIDGPTDHLGGRRALLILDNCEHLLPGLAHDVADLLWARADVAVLATSREPLHLRWEHRLPVRPLALPDPGDEGAPEALLASPAVALFVARVRAVRPDFALTAENGPAVAELCRRLDGLPLAIELAAARADLLGPMALLERIERHLPLPARGAEDAPARHRTLDAAIGWSYQQLRPAERALLRRLASLPGTWTLGQAEATADAALGLDVLAAVLELVDKGLVVAVRHDDASRFAEPRFAMLQTVRAYVTDLGVDADDAGETPRRATAPAGSARNGAAEPSATEASDRAEGTAADNPLSPREQAVLRLVADGLPSKQIGRELGLAERTVKAHVTGAMNKLGAFSRAQALGIAVRHQYV